MNAQDSIEDTEETQIKMVLKGKTKMMFDRLKEYYNLGYNAELVRLLIKRAYDTLVAEE